MVAATGAFVLTLGTDALETREADPGGEFFFGPPRGDYRQTKRDSNVPSLRNDTGAFVLQIGFGYFGSSGQP